MRPALGGTGAEPVAFRCTSTSDCSTGCATSRVGRRAVLGCPDYVAAAVLAEHEQGPARLAAAATGRRQDQRGHAPPPVAHLAVGLTVAAAPAATGCAPGAAHIGGDPAGVGALTRMWSDRHPPPGRDQRMSQVDSRGKLPGSRTDLRSLVRLRERLRLRLRRSGCSPRALRQMPARPRSGRSPGGRQLLLAESFDSVQEEIQRELELELVVAT